jgi:SnoaL-like domain
MTQTQSAPGLSPIDRAVIGWECERLIHHYALLNDAGDFPAMAQLFTADGAFARPTDAATLIRGREAILAMYLSRPPRFTRHMITSVVISAQDADNATGHSYLSLHTAQAGGTPPAPADPTYLIGAFHDRFAREDGVWKFAERRGSLALKVGG